MNLLPGFRIQWKKALDFKTKEKKTHETTPQVMRKFTPLTVNAVNPFFPVQGVLVPPGYRRTASIWSPYFTVVDKYNHTDEKCAWFLFIISFKKTVLSFPQICKYTTIPLNTSSQQTQRNPFGCFSKVMTPKTAWKMIPLSIGRPGV